MSTTACDFKLAASVGFNCANPVKKGVKNTAWIMNFDDIDTDTTTYDSTTPNKITSLKLKTGAKAYTCYVPGKTPFTGTQKVLATGTYLNTFTKTVALVVLDNGADVSHKIIDQLANGRFVVVIENNYTGTGNDNTFEVYGIETGLAATEISDEKYSEDTEGGWKVTLEEENAPTSGIFYLSTDVATTRTALGTLVTGTTSGS